MISECKLYVHVSDPGALLCKHILLKCYAKIFKTLGNLQEYMEEFCRYKCEKYLENATKPCTFVAYTYLKLWIIWMLTCIWTEKEANIGAENSSCDVVQKLMINRTPICAIRLVLWWLQRTLWSKQSPDEWNIQYVLAHILRELRRWFESWYQNYQTALVDCSDEGTWYLYFCHLRGRWERKSSCTKRLILNFDCWVVEPMLLATFVHCAAACVK